MRLVRRALLGPRLRGRKTVGLILGPYRNLTTLTASVLSLHPACQVLNHAGPRLLSGDRDFIEAYSDRRLRAFCRAALDASAGGKRGDFGGSILLSHAFDDERLRELYEARYGERAVKAHPTCLVWKESQLVTDRIRRPEDKIITLVESAPRLRFLLPVRNPLDCATSNVRTGHALRIDESLGKTGVLDWILEVTAWFAALAEAHPDRFFMFFQDDPAQDIADGLLGLLGIGDDGEWRRAMQLAFDVRAQPYEHDGEMFEAFDRGLDRYFKSLPAVEQRLRRLVGASVH